MKLLVSAACKLAAGVLLIVLVLFWPAGTWRYLNGWLFCGLLFIPMALLGLLLFWKAPALLEKRLRTRETERAQRAVVATAALLFIASFAAAGLDFRFGWTRVPSWLVAAAAAVQLAAYGLYGEVLRENDYLSRTVEVQEGQKVIDTGLYGVIRHPMYAATILLFLAMPLVLGSWASFALMLLYPAVILVRIHHEEKLLETGLEGYRDYEQRVRYRLFPFIW